ncbi:hypothetical protein IPV08_21735 [Methylobacterium sp. SD274]|uniref:helix-turn-helix domain-containing protein n=1 Tax=Methylobacterium sp. SD274 TaxID=2782009 RepID=UPI001A965B77|nr:helix-turn-helix domain-containing protein [Methylobacterium sp. SD274]MBO1022588.1 hypothetical protein [Methylobacterium sp. SD274]
MSGGGPLPVREFATVAEMRAHAKAVRERCFGVATPRPAPAAMPGPPPLPPFVRRPWDRARYLEAMEGLEPGDHNLRSLVRVVSAVTKIDATDLLVEGRAPERVKARQIIMFLARVVMGRSLPQIGATLNRDHTSVIYGVRKVGAIVDALGLDRSTDVVAMARALWGREWPSKPRAGYGSKLKPKQEAAAASSLLEAVE